MPAPDTTPSLMNQHFIVKIELGVPAPNFLEHVFPPSVRIHNEDWSVFKRDAFPPYVMRVARWLFPRWEGYAYAVVHEDKILLDINRGRAPNQEW